MNRWQSVDGDDISTESRQLGVAIIQKVSAQESGVDLKIRTPQFPFARDL